MHFSKVDEKYRKKLEQTNDNEKTQRRAAEMEAGVATELVLVIDDQKKAVEKELEVRWWVWAPDQRIQEKTRSGNLTHKAKTDTRRTQDTHKTHTTHKNLEQKKNVGLGLVYKSYPDLVDRISPPPSHPASQFVFSPATTQFPPASNVS